MKYSQYLGTCACEIVSSSRHNAISGINAGKNNLICLTKLQNKGSYLSCSMFYEVQMEINTNKKAWPIDPLVSESFRLDVSVI